MSAKNVLAKFSERIEALPKELQTIFYVDLETAIENRLRILERA
jgi:hypothetical protein